MQGRPHGQAGPCGSRTACKNCSQLASGSMENFRPGQCSNSSVVIGKLLRRNVIPVWNS